MAKVTIFKIQGTVQGVGFRPFVFRKCRELGLFGYIKNSANGVELAIDKHDMINDILKPLPPFAKVDLIRKIGESEIDSKDFTIIGSEHESSEIAIPPDIATCENCEKELRDRNDRRHDYFFITCTNCGPRFSTVTRMPYDRENTSMDEFSMCEKCEEEYKNPDSRRFHAQTIACEKCGPRLFYKKFRKNFSLDDAINDILSGELVAIKGIGGFHIACIPEKATVAGLRKITGRQKKPFALMAKDISIIEKFCHVNTKEKILLQSPSRPIITLEKKNSKDMEFISELDTLGFMLPYTPLHHMLFDKIDSPLVMTSSNISDEPITINDDEQIIKNILTHNRRITNRVDDSVVKVVNDKTLLLRRSRGYVPLPIKVDIDTDKTVLALGSEMNNSISVLRNGKVYMSQFLGNTSNHKTFQNMKKSVDNFLEFLGAKPDMIVCDLHPQLNTTLYARKLSEIFNIPLKKVQHHRAHANSVLLENGIDKAVSVVCDGTGYGSDGNIWGGEVFLGEKRVASLEEHIMPGGESAIENPWKMLGGMLSSFLKDDEFEKEMKPYISGNSFDVFSKQINERFNTPITTSCGRVLDCASVLLGLCKNMHYDARPAMLIESVAKGEPYDIEPVIENKERIILKTSPLFEFLIENKDKDRGRLSSTVHNYLSEGFIKIANTVDKNLPRTFSGGVAYNRHITSRLLEEGFIVNEKVPSGDGGISFGQFGIFNNKIHY